MDMRFYWLKYQIWQGHYNVFWKLGATNFSDYFTKHHPPHHHHRMVPVYLHYQDNENNSSVRVCNSSHNTSLKERPNQTHLNIIKMETHIEMDG